MPVNLDKVNVAFANIAKARGKGKTMAANMNIDAFTDELETHIENEDWTKVNRVLNKLEAEDLPYETTLWIDDMRDRIAGMATGGRKRFSKSRSRSRSKKSSLRKRSSKLRKNFKSQKRTRKATRSRSRH